MNKVTVATHSELKLNEGAILKQTVHLGYLSAKPRKMKKIKSYSVNRITP